MKTLLTSIGIMLLLATVLPAQENRKAAPDDNTPITYGKYRKIHSKVLGEDRTLLVRLPADYDKSDIKYPVLYILDGDKDVCLRPYAAVNYLFMSEIIPDHIIVGIENTDRGRDFGPEQGADNFIQFIKTELIPFVDKNYRTNGFKILCGQSFGAVFTLNSFLKQPDLFDAYFLISCGLFKESWAAIFENAMKENQDLKKLGKKYLFVANGKQDSYAPNGSIIMKRTSQFLKSLKRSISASVLMKTKDYDDEGHVPYPSIYDGLKWIYSSEKATTK